MKILFLTLSLPHNPSDSNLYSQLAVEYRNQGHEVTIISADNSVKHSLICDYNGCRVLRVNSLKQKGVKSVLQKGLAQYLLPYQFKTAFKKYLNRETFDVVFMPTPPITLNNFVKYIKKRTGAIFYLILRDIYPQGAADLGLIKSRIMYDYLKRLEKSTYRNADIIGCMSPGNINYVAENNPNIDRHKMVLLPNWQTPVEIFDDGAQVSYIRQKYDLDNKFVILFGGTIGYAQKVENIIALAQYCLKYPDVRIAIVGKGVKKDYLLSKAKENCLNNIVFMDWMSHDEYMSFAKSCDIGLITIDDRFTVPTIPSKTVSYFNLGLPILAIVDRHTDYPDLIQQSGAGLCSIGPNLNQLFENFDILYFDKDLREQMSLNGYNYFILNLTTNIAYSQSISQIYTHLNKSNNGC